MPADGKRRHRLRRWGRLVFVALLAYGVASWIAATTLLTPRRHVPTAPPALGAQTLDLITSDGVQLAAWVVEPKGPARATVLVFHGMDGHRSPGHLAFLAEHGFRGVAVDLRAHGESGGAKTGFGLHERLDVRATVAHARHRWPDVPLLAWGTSLGAAALVFAATEDPPQDPPVPFVDGLVLESLYTDIDTAFANRIRQRAGAWMLPFAEGPRWLAGVLGDLDPAAMRPVDRMPALADVPLLLCSGADDRRATPEELQRLHAAAPHAETILLPGLGHVDLLRRGPPEYGEQIATFLAQAAELAGS